MKHFLSMTMDGEQNLKRPCVNEPQAHVGRTSRPTKKIKPQIRSEMDTEFWVSWQYPPEFYDRLPKVHLTRLALKELDRRNGIQHQVQHPSPSTNSSRQRYDLSCNKPFGIVAQELARFARRGGPDLLDLRGYPHPAIDHPRALSVALNDRMSLLDSFSPTPTTRKSGPYNPDFALHLSEHRVNPLCIPQLPSQKRDARDVMGALIVRRPSLSPSQFSDCAFEAFCVSELQAKNEKEVLRTVIPTILGSTHPDQFSADDVLCTNFEPLTDGTLVSPKPDIYYGARPARLARPIRDELDSHIVPSTRKDLPAVPNFFLEVKGPHGTIDVATLQARYDGAFGSRAMRSLQNYGKEEPEYDGKPYTFSATYFDGTLKLYAHHVTEPTDSSYPEYHMTRLKGFIMTNSRDEFVQGATALRNAVDLAGKYRDDFIEAANLRRLE